ncbi:MAG TPA: hypothetical protein VLJ88_12965 [Propionibacteriaceae bacterium]|nr:hypothetical protein [Propionibacteriaceae bacterium]
MTEPTDADVADDDDVRTAQVRRDAAQRERTSTHEALADVGTSTDPRLATTRTAIAGLDGDFTTKTGRLDQIAESKKAATGEVEQLSAWFLDAAAQYEELGNRLTSLKPARTPMQATADKIFRDADNAIETANRAIADPAIQAGLVIPALGPMGPDPTPVERVTAARNALQTALGGVARTVNTAAELAAVQGLVPTTSTVNKSVGDARNEIRPVNQVQTQIDAVENVYKETTNYGNVGDRTAEGAAREEVRTGQPVGGLWHGQKCRDYAANLVTIIANLKQQKAAFPKNVHKAIDAAIARAEDRRVKLQAGADVWYAYQAQNPGFGQPVE